MVPDLLSSLDLPSTAAVVLAGGLVRGFSGFGLALVTVPLLSLILGPPQAVATVILLQVSSDVQLFPGAVRHIHWRQIAPMGLTAALLVPVGAQFLVTVNPHLMRRIISVVVVSFTLVLMSGWRYRSRPGLPVAMGVATLSGFLGGMAGTSGPPMVLYLFSGPGSAGSNRYNLIGYFVFLDVVSLLTFTVKGVITHTVVWRVLILLPVLFLAVRVGAWLFTHLSEAMLRWAALVLILLVGVFGLLSA